MAKIAPTPLRSGGLLQSGIPKQEKTSGEPYHGLIRGVVVATYCTDDPDHPLKQYGITPTSVYVDVVAVGTFQGGSRFYFIPGAQVLQPMGGMHTGAVFKPKAATRLVGGKPLSSITPQDLNQADGQWVAVQFWEGKTNAPVVVGYLPHPSRDMGNPDTLPIGQRQRLKLVDGDPSLFRHHGSFYGIDTDGGFVADTTRANSGQLTPTSGEPEAGIDNGDISLRLPPAATFSVALCQSAATGIQTALTTLSVVKGGQTLDTGAQTPDVQVKSAAGNTLSVSGAQSSASLALGDGSSHPALYEALQVWWSSVAIPYFTAVNGPLPPPPPLSPSIRGAALSIPSRSG